MLFLLLYLICDCTLTALILALLRTNTDAEAFIVCHCARVKGGCIVSPNREWLSKIHSAADVATIEALLRAAVKHQCLSLAAYKHPRKIVISHTPLTLTSTRKVRRCLYAGTLDE